MQTVAPGICCYLDIWVYGYGIRLNQLDVFYENIGHVYKKWNHLIIYKLSTANRLLLQNICFLTQQKLNGYIARYVSMRKETAEKKWN